MAVDQGGIKKGTQKEVEVDLDEVFRELELKMDRLKVLYEQYFMGIEKMAPATQRKDVERRMVEMTQLQLRNTAHRYRLNSLQQRFGSMRTYWSRVEREIENGTHIRTIAKISRDAIRKGQDIPAEVLRTMPEKMRARVLAERAKVAAQVVRGAGGAKPAAPTARTAAPTKPPQEEEAGFDDMVDNLFDSITTKSSPALAMPSGTAPPAPTSAPPRVAPPPMPRAATPPPVPGARPGPPPPPTARRVLPQGMTDRAVDELYERYVAAKKQVGDDVRGITPDALAQTLAAQTPKILTDHKAKTIDYQVVVKDNRVVLKATPKK